MHTYHPASSHAAAHPASSPSTRPYAHPSNATHLCTAAGPATCFTTHYFTCIRLATSPYAVTQPTASTLDRHCVAIPTHRAYLPANEPNRTSLPLQHTPL